MATVSFPSYEDASRANAITEFGATANGGTDDTAAINAALASGASHVHFPPGVYAIAGSITGSVADQCITFAPGAKLKIAPAAGSVTFSGARQRISGLHVWLAVASSTTFDALKIAGDGTLVDGCRVDVDDDIANCTLVKITGPRTRLQNLKLTSVGKAFKYGLHVVGASGEELDYVTVDGIDADVGDDGQNVTFGALLYLRGRRSQYRDISFQAGGRALFPAGVVIVDSHFTTIENPYVMAPKAQYGIYLCEGSEFCYIRGGWIQAVAGGGWLTDSEGIHLGHYCDHFSGHDVTVTGWDFGLGIHGSNNIPNLIGFDTSNNQTAGILLDSNIGGLDWPITGLTMVGCYGENAAAQPVYIWAKSGYLIGGVMKSCQVGFTTNMIKVENAAFGGFSVHGCRIIAADGTGEVFAPNADTSIFFGLNALERTSILASGVHASRIRTAVDSSTTALALTSLTLGSGGTAITGRFKALFTANFGSGIPANDMVELPFTFSGALITDRLSWSVTGALAAHTGLTFVCYVASTGQLTLRARNHTASPIAPIAGSLVAEVVRG